LAEIVCPRCAHPNSVAANFCSSCGYDLSRLSTELAETQELEMPGANAEDLNPLDPESGAAEFVVKRGEKAGSRFIVDAALVTIGRHPDSRIFLDDVTVSRRHAEVRYADGYYAVTDVGSLNGTYLNRERVEGARLTSGDELQVGKFKLVFLLGDPT